jgi:DNA-binding PadR family transcriptional regulator
MARRTGLLEVAILGLLHETPMHGYQLRKRLNTLLGTFRAISYGSLYPCLKGMLQTGWIAEEDPDDTGGKRAKIVYKLTADGKDHFAELMAACGPEEWEDDNFGVRFAFFARTDVAVRLRILEGRRGRLEERMDGFRSSASRTAERLDAYTLELQRHGLESVEREVRWLTELIDTERAAPRPATSTPTRTTSEIPK